MAETYYETLGVPANASYNEIDDAFRQMFARHRNDPTHRKKIQDAYNVLSNPNRRKQYNQQLQTAAKSASTSPLPNQPSQQHSPSAGTVKPGRTLFLENNPNSKETTSAGTGSSSAPLPPDPPKQNVRARTVINTRPPSSVTPNVSKPQQGSTPGRTSAARQRTVIVEYPPVPDGTVLNTASLSGETSDGTLYNAVAWIQVEYPDKSLVQFPLREGDNLIGRTPREGPRPDVEIQDPEKYVSRQHATLRVAGGMFILIDHGSKNGTYLNDQRMTPKQEYPVSKGDVIRIEGRLLRLVDE